MGCFDDLVGVKGCGASPTGVYVQQLTGISITDFDKAINTDHKAALPALQSIVGDAINDALNDIRQRLAVKYELKSFIENNVLGYYYDDKPLQSAETGYITGYQVKIDKTPYLSFHIGTLSLFVNTTGNVDVKVWDLVQGKLLDTITVAAVAGEIVTVNVNKTYPTNKQRLNLFIGYESVGYYKTSFSSPYQPWSEWCDVCFNGNSSHMYFRSGKILTGSQKINDNIQNHSHGNGISFGYSLQCSFDEYLCNASNMIAYPMLYKAGQLIMREMKYSRRLNSIVTVYHQDYDELMGLYESEYNTRMDNLMDAIAMPDGICFGCNKMVKTETVLP